MQKFRKFMKDNAEVFKEMKLLGEYTQMCGGVSGMYVWLVEYDSLAGLEKLSKRLEKDEEAKKAYARMDAAHRSLFSINRCMYRCRVTKTRAQELYC